MKKHRFLSLALALALTLSLAACSLDSVKQEKPAEKEKPAYEQYMEASEKMGDIDSFTAGMYISMNIDMSDDGSGMGMAMDVVMDAVISVVYLGADDANMKVDMTMEMLGMSIPVVAYYLDGYYYTNTMGEKAKMAMSFEEAASQYSVDMVVFPEEGILEQYIEQVDGGALIHFTIGGEALMGAGGMSDMYSGILGDDMDIFVEEIEIIAFMNDEGVIEYVTMLFSFDMDFMGVAALVSSEATISYLQLGGVTIDFPDDLDTYPLTVN